MKRGFTIIELLVVVAILGILASIILATTGPMRAKARDARRVSDLEQIFTALTLYYDDHGKLPFEDWCRIQQGCSPDYDNAAASSGDFITYTPTGNIKLWSELGAELSPYLSELPVDPLNNGNLFSNGLYSYHYAVTDQGELNLIAKFETAHPLRCEKVGYWANYGRQGGVDLSSNEGYWCFSLDGTYPNSQAFAFVRSNPSFNNISKYFFTTSKRGRF